MSQKYDYNRENRGESLFEKNAFWWANSAKNRRNNYARKKKYLDIERPFWISDEKWPNKSRSEKSVVQALIGGESSCFFKKFVFERDAKNFAAQRCPREHFDVQNIKMLQCYHEHKKVGKSFHNLKKFVVVYRFFSKYKNILLFRFSRI